MLRSFVSPAAGEKGSEGFHNIIWMLTDADSEVISWILGADSGYLSCKGVLLKVLWERWSPLAVDPAPAQDIPSAPS